MRLATKIRTLLVIGAVVLLELACRTGLLSPHTIVAPSEMAQALGHELLTAELYDDLAATLLAVLVSSVLAVSLGFAVGIGLHVVPAFRRLCDPYLSAWYAIPVFAFYPVLIVMFGLGAGPLIALAVLLGAPAMVVATLTALDRVPPVLRRSARMFRLTPIAELRYIRLPASVPYLVTGLQLSISYAFIGVIAGEFILSTVGLGHEIAMAYDAFATPRMYGLILLTIMIVVGANSGLHALRRWFAAGQPG